MILVSIYETTVNDKDTLYDTWRAIWDTSSRMAPAWVVISLILAEVGDWTMVLAEMFREKRRRDQERRVKEAASQGRAEGRVEGLAQNQAQWLDWLKRREEAERNNHPFNEPPPSLDDSNNGSMR
jgi:hypothetical protein